MIFINEEMKKGTVSKETKIISAFPACGKSHFFREQEENGFIVLDSDSTHFSWIKDENGNNTKERNPEFPANYIRHIQDNIGKVDYILVSSHKDVRDALERVSIPYILVFPNKDLKDEWVGRCFLRGSGEAFCKLIADNWDNWLDEIEELTYPYKYYLSHGEYLSDAINNIKELDGDL